MAKELLSLIVPVYKEEGNIEPFLKRVVPILRSTGLRYEIIFSLDPSPDDTERKIRAAIARDKNVRLLLFSRRFGQPAATIAGLRACEGDAAIVIDVDLQDPPELFPEMVRRWKAGADVVAARRKSRRGETWFKRWISTFGYWLINKASDVAIPRETGDYRLMSRRVIDAVCGLKEGHGFLRGLVAFVGYKQDFIEFDRSERAEGEGKYNRFTGSLKIGFNGLVGFSNFLLNATLIVGLAVAALGALGACFILWAFFVWKIKYETGIPTLTILSLGLGGLQMVGTGILGLYIGRIYDEVRQRPMAIVSESVNLGGPKARRKGR